MKLLGQYGTKGEYNPYVKPIEVTQFWDTLRDNEGMVWAVKDEYGDWVSPNLKRIGVKSIVKTEANAQST